MHGRADRVSLLERVAESLREARLPFALIGAAAMASYGVTRSTFDQDLLTLGAEALLPETWAGLREAGVTVEVRRGDAFDPLAGVVRLSMQGERPVDLVVGKFVWQREILERAVSTPGGIPIVRAADLILLKLYAGGPQDAWDIQQLLAGEDREALIAEVEKEVPRLTREAAELWKRVTSG
jgi:hypothetical protein